MPGHPQSKYEKLTPCSRNYEHPEEFHVVLSTGGGTSVLREGESDI